MRLQQVIRRVLLCQSDSYDEVVSVLLAGVDPVPIKSPTRVGLRQ
jgi:hypothetical protein